MLRHGPFLYDPFQQSSIDKAQRTATHYQQGKTLYFDQTPIISIDINGEIQIKTT